MVLASTFLVGIHEVETSLDYHLRVTSRKRCASENLLNSRLYRCYDVGRNMMCYEEVVGLMPFSERAGFWNKVDPGFSLIAHVSSSAIGRYVHLDPLATI